MSRLETFEQYKDKIIYDKVRDLKARVIAYVDDSCTSNYLICKLYKKDIKDYTYE